MFFPIHNFPEYLGKELNCWVIEVEVGGKVSKSWMSNEVGVSGVVKSIYDGKVSMELVDFGTK